jgi:hypothetical protein
LQFNKGHESNTVLFARKIQHNNIKPIEATQGYKKYSPSRTDEIPLKE